MTNRILIEKDINLDNFSYLQLVEYINDLKKEYKIISMSFTKGSVLHIIAKKKDKDKGGMTNKQIADNFNKIFIVLDEIKKELVRLDQKIDQGFADIRKEFNQEISKIKEFVGMK